MFFRSLPSYFPQVANQCERQEKHPWKKLLWKLSHIIIERFYMIGMTARTPPNVIGPDNFINRIPSKIIIQKPNPNGCRNQAKNGAQKQKPPGPKRKIFFLIGFPLWAFTTALFPLSGYFSPVSVILAVMIAIIFDCIMTFFGSTATDATLSAYTIDVSEVDNRGVLISVREIGLLIATLLVYGLSGFIIETLGYYIFFYMVGLIVGGFGIAGSLLAHWIGFINAEHFSLTESILYIGMIIIGGLGTATGPIFGVVFIRLLQEGITQVSPILESIFAGLPAGFTTGIGPMLFGLAIILFLVLEPRGLAHRWALFKASYRIWPFSY